MSSGVTLRELTKEDWKKCAGLRVGKDQEDFVSSNIYGIAESRFDPLLRLFAVYHAEKMVGMVVYLVDGDVGVIHHFMISGQHQRKGYGRAALLEALEILRSTEGCREAKLSYWPGNPAVSLYESVGFRHTGEEWDGEPVMALQLQA